MPRESNSFAQIWKNFRPLTTYPKRNARDFQDANPGVKIISSIFLNKNGKNMKLMSFFLSRVSGPNGGNATAQHVLDRGSIPEEGRGYSVRVPENSHVHIRFCLLLGEEQPE